MTNTLQRPNPVLLLSRLRPLRRALCLVPLIPPYFGGDNDRLFKDENPNHGENSEIGICQRSCRLNYHAASAKAVS